MDTRASFQNALEDLNGMILAADPGDPSALARLSQQLQQILATEQPSAAETEILSLAISGLRDAQGEDAAAVLRVVAAAIAELSDHVGNMNDSASASLEVASAALREALQSPDMRADAFAANGSGAVEVDADLLKEFIAESNDRIAQAEAATLLLEQNPDDSESINTVLRAFHTIKGASGLLGLTRLQKLAHHAESLLIRGRDGELRMVGRHIELTLQSCDALKFMIDSLDQSRLGSQPALPNDYEAIVAALGEHEQRPRLNSEQKFIAASPQTTPATPRPTSPLDDAREEPAATSPLPASSPSAASAEASVRVNTDRLESLVNLVGELVIAQAIVAQDSRSAGDRAARLARSVDAAGKITRQLQDLAMSLRMVPLKGAFQKMARLVRDVAHKSDKAVQFDCSGEDTEIDRNMVEVLIDPLAHMIRNAVDHGIEASVERVARGKPAAGTLHLRAYHSAGSVVIELEDDGKGLNRERIWKRAIDRGIVQAGENLTDDEVHTLIFHPGLSTAEIVTEISGRGVGLDVVKQQVDSLRGRIEVTTAPGEGTRFTLRLPLTTAIVDAMSVRVGQQNYLLPTVVIERSFRPDAGTVSSVAGRGEMVMFHDQLLPLFRLHRLFRIDGAEQIPQRAIAIIIEGAGRRCAVMVDELLGQQQAVMKSLGSSLAKLEGVAGGAILSTGRVGLILDAAGLVQLAHGQRDGAKSAANSPAQQPTPDRIRS